MSNPRVAFVQDGARLHYAIPIALQRAGILDRVFTEWYSSPGSLASLLSTIAKWRNPAFGQRMLERYHSGLDASKVTSNTLLEMRLMRKKKRSGPTAAYFQWHAAERSRWIQRVGFGDANVLMGYISNIDPGLLDRGRSRGLTTIADQIIAPAAVMAHEDQLQRQRFPEWDPHTPSTEFDRLIEYEHATWKQLDHITCASAYVRDGLLQQGIPDEKITVIPYPVDADHFPFVDRSTHQGPVTVGFVGRVNLRKGAPYFLEVARRFDPAKVKFLMVGPVDIPASVADKFMPHVQLVGSVPRSRIAAFLSQFDIYFFPSTCEGSAGSISEAMCTGLPIVTSPNSGSVIQHGQEGFLCNYDNIDTAAAYLERLVSDRQLRLEMGRRAADYYRQFDASKYASTLGDFVRTIRQRQGSETVCKS